MSELTQEEKREKFIKKANENKAKFDKHLRLKKEVFGDIKPEYLKTIFENGAIDDLFSLKLIEYVDAYNECELKQLDLHNVIVPKGTVCELTEWDGKDETNLCDCGKGEGNCKKQTAL